MAHRDGFNSRQETLELKKSAASGQQESHHRSNTSDILKYDLASAKPIDDLARKHQSRITALSRSSLIEHHIIESVAWTEKLDKFLVRPAISTLLDSYTTKPITSSRQKPVQSLHSLPNVKRINPRYNVHKSAAMKYDADTMLPFNRTDLDKNFLNQADNVEEIVNIASRRRVTQLELDTLRDFTKSEVLSSAWDDELAIKLNMTSIDGNRRSRRRNGLFFLPSSSSKNEFRKNVNPKHLENDHLILSQRSDISVPACLFDEENSSKILPDISRVEKRRTTRQEQFRVSGALSILGPNAQSDSDPFSDECEGPEKDRVSHINAHKPTLMHKRSGIVIVDHDELNPYSDFSYAVSYQKAFASELATTNKERLQPNVQLCHERNSLFPCEAFCMESDLKSMPETCINWKTSMTISNDAACEYCRFCALNKLPILHTIIRSSLTHSYHKNVSLAGSNIHAVCHYFKHAASTIQELAFVSCSLGNDEFKVLGASCFQLMGVLVCLKLVDCNFGFGGVSMSKALSLLRHLSSIQLSDCKLRDVDCANILSGLACNNSKCICITMNHNLASTVTADALSKCFRYSHCNWEVLDLSWNRISSSRSMCSSIRHCDNLTEINLSWNGLRDEIALNALCYALRFHQKMRHLNLQHCGLGDKHALLLSELLSDCMALVSIDLRNNSINSYGCRSILRVLGLRHQCAQNDGQSLEICHVMLPISGSIPDSLIDYDLIAGPAEFSLRSPSDRHILKSILIKKDKNMVSFENESFQLDGNQMPLGKLRLLIEAFESSDLNYHNSLALSSDFSNFSEDHNVILPPDINTVTMTIQNTFQTPTDDALVTSWEMHFVKSICASSELEQKMRFISFLLGGSNLFRLEQLKELIFLLKPGYRVEAVKLALTHCWESDGSQQIMSWLSSSEQKKVQTQVSEELLHFTPNNPTNHYRLILSNRFDRDICFKLLATRNDILDVLKHDKSYQNSRHRLEKVAFNVTLEGIPFTITPNWCVPMNGTLELDFVYCLNADPTSFPTIDDETVFGFTTAPDSAQRKQIKLLRSMSNQYLFTCTQAVRIMQYFRDDALKVESLVILFSRIVDYPGFQRLVKSLDWPKLSSLRKRIGSHNLFNDLNAVGFHELDLSDPQQRFVCGRLVDLAVVEPGENMCGCRYNEIDFDVPSGWLEEIPQKGVFSVFYCRSAQVIKKIFQKIPSECIPSNLELLSPPGTEWVAQAKKKRIKLKLSLAFTNVEDAFNKMDEDGGGSLSRLEFSRGLRMLGVQVTAYELLDLVDLLDEDGSGFIELQEMVSFWESC